MDLSIGVRPGVNLDKVGGDDGGRQQAPQLPPSLGKVTPSIKMAKMQIAEEFGNAALRSAEKASYGKIFPDNQAKIDFLRKEAQAVRDMSYGLRGMTDQRYDLGPLGRDSYAKGDKFGERYNVHKEKDVGRDPGILGKKAWSDKDTAKMNDPQHRFCTQSNQFIDKALRGYALDQSKAFRDCAMTLLSKHPTLSEEYGKFLSDNNKTRHIGSAREFLATIANTKLGETFYTAMKAHKGIGDLCKQHVQENNEKFSKLHQVKGDYKERDLNIFGRVRLPFAMIQAKLVKPDAGVFGKLLGNIKAGLQYVFGAEPKKSANEGMVREAVANDLMRAMGEVTGDKTYVTQKLKLVQATYGDGSPKLMLDSTFIGKSQTEKSIPNLQLPEGSKFETFEGRIVDGYLVDQQYVAPTDTDPGGFGPIIDGVKTDKSGQPRTRPDMPPSGPPFKEGSSVENLGRTKIKMLLLGDRDALGSLGANKGHVGNHMAMIDPGHSFERNRMVQHTVKSDFSFDQPRKMGAEKMPGYADIGYKNFSIFDKAPLSEKMKGVKDIQDLAKTGRDVAIFEQYEEQFGAGKGDLDFSDSIKQWKDMHVERRDKILETFDSRLKVFDFNLSGVPGEQEKRVDQTFDLMDNLEKLTSRSTTTSPNGLVELARPRVLERVEWGVVQNQDGSLTFSAPSSPEARERLESFLGKEFGILVNEDGGRLSMTMQPDLLATFMTRFSDTNVFQAVKDRTAG
jgi:hypothetical protein